MDRLPKLAVGQPGSGGALSLDVASSEHSGVRTGGSNATRIHQDKSPHHLVGQVGTHGAHSRRAADQDKLTEGYIEASGKLITPGQGKLLPFHGSATESEQDIQSFYFQKGQPVRIVQGQRRTDTLIASPGVPQPNSQTKT